MFNFKWPIVLIDKLKVNQSYYNLPMENQPQNYEFRLNPETFHPSKLDLFNVQANWWYYKGAIMSEYT